MLKTGLFGRKLTLVAVLQATRCTDRPRVERAPRSRSEKRSLRNKLRPSTAREKPLLFRPLLEYARLADGQLDPRPVLDGSDRLRRACFRTVWLLCTRPGPAPAALIDSIFGGFNHEQNPGGSVRRTCSSQPCRVCGERPSSRQRQGQSPAANAARRFEGLTSHDRSRLFARPSVKDQGGEGQCRWLRSSAWQSVLQFVSFHRWSL
jgi:hypothetical protein